MLFQRQAGVSVYAMVPVIELVVDSGPGAGPEQRSDGIGDVVSRRGASQMTAVLALDETPQTAHYITHTPEAVGAFLAHYPFLVPLLTEALGPLEDAFGTDTPFVVAVETDPEVADWEELRVDVEPPCPSIRRIAAWRSLIRPGGSQTSREPKANSSSRWPSYELCLARLRGAGCGPAAGAHDLRPGGGLLSDSDQSRLLCGVWRGPHACL